MKLEHPAWLHWLWVIPFLLLLRLWAEQRAAGAARSLVASRLREWLVSSASPLRSWGIFVLQVLSLSGLIFTLAKPTWGEEKIELPEVGRNLMIVIDTSRSMLANDLEPNRLTRAKLAAEDVISTLGEFRVGMVAFAGRGYLQAPLTSDHAAVIETIQALDTNTIPRGGSLLSEGIRESREAFKKTKARSHGILLFSDGGDEDPALDEELKKAKAENVKVLAVGVGTALGSLIPDVDDQNRRVGTDQVVIDPETGQAVRTSLDEKLLRKSAEATSGTYLTLGAQSLTGGFVTDVMRSIEGLESGIKEQTKPIQRFYWPLSLSIVSLMLSLILRPLRSAPLASPATAAAALAIGFLATTSNTQAAIFGDPPEVREAREAFEGQEYQRARDCYARLLAEDHPPGDPNALAYGLGAAAHQLKDYDRALENYSKALQAPDLKTQNSAHRALGTALYEQGAKAVTKQPEFTVAAWTDSLRHYDAALKISSDNKTTLNRKHVQEQLDNLKKQQESKQQKKGDKGQKGDKSDKGEKGEKQDGQQGEDGEPQEGQKGQQGDQKEGQEGESKDGQEGQKGEQGEQKGQGGEGEKKDGQEGKAGQSGEEKDGKSSEQAQQQKPGDDGKLPEGQIQAGEAGKNAKQDAERIQQLMEDKVMDTTGFSRNQARELLKAYSDQMATQFKRRREPSVAKDW